MTWAELRDHPSTDAVQNKVAALRPSQREMIVCERNHEVLMAAENLKINSDASRELARVLTGRREPFQDGEWNIFRQHWFHNAETGRVQWSMPKEGNQGVKYDMWAQPEFANHPLLTPFYAVLAQGSYQSSARREVKFFPLTDANDILIMRPIAYKDIARTGQWTTVPVQIGLFTKKNGRFVHAKQAPVYEVTEPSARNLAAQTRTLLKNTAQALAL